MTEKLTVSPSPHIHSGDSIEKNMHGVLIALIPAFLVSLVAFGLGALIVTAISVTSCLLFEYVIQRFMLKRQPTITDGSAAITGVLLAFNLPANLPAWMVIIGAFVAIAIAKMSFGGLGNNIFNPALVGRVFLLISFPAQMTVWPKPGFFPLEYTDATTGATTLALIKYQANSVFSYANILLGEHGGSIGEVSAIALLLGFTYLLWRRIIAWHIPVVTVLTVVVFTGTLHFIDPLSYANPLLHVLSGGLLLGAVFMATDYTTSPMSKSGMLVYAVGIGLITSVIRIFGVYPEGISFAILIMNAFTPLINMYMQPKRFGEEVKHG